MSASMRRFPRAWRATIFAIGLGAFALPVLGACSVMDHLRPGSKAKAEAQDDTETASTNQIDVRRYIGPNYCPELRIFEGAQLIRTYERGHQGDQASIIWQASIGSTARECLYDTQGNLTLKIGISGRALTGPKGKPDTVSVPLKIAVVKYQASVLDTERLTLPVTIPPQGSTTFRQVKEVTVPSPGSNRDYVIFVGFDVGNWDPMKPGDAVAIETTPAPAAPAAAVAVPDLAAAVQPASAPPPPPPAAAAPAKPKVNELPVPSDGFVLSQ